MDHRTGPSPCCLGGWGVLSKSEAASPSLEPSWTTPCALGGEYAPSSPSLLREDSSLAHRSIFLLARLLPLTQASGEIGDLR